MVKGKIPNRLRVPHVGFADRVSRAATRAVARIYKRHRYRYHAWDQGSYRFLVQTIALVILLALAGAVAWVGRAAYHKHQEMLAADKAAECLAQGDYGAASRNASRALALNRANARAAEVMAKVATGTHLPDELSRWQRVAMLAPTTENKLALAEAALRCEPPPYPATTGILEELTAIGPSNAAYQEIAGRLALSTHRMAEAQFHLENACRLEATNREYALNLAVFQLNAATGAEKAAVRRRLDAFTSDDNFRVVALRALAKDTLTAGDLSAALYYSTQLVAIPAATFKDQLRNLAILQQANRELLPAALAEVERRAETNSQAIVEVSDWMRRHQLVAQNIDWLTALPDTFLAARPSVESALARSYLQNSNWQAILSFTSHGEWGDFEFMRLAVISRAWSQLGMATLAASNWGAAVNKATYQYAAMTNLLALASQWQLKPEAADLRQRCRQFGRSPLADDFGMDTPDTP